MSATEVLPQVEEETTARAVPAAARVGRTRRVRGVVATVARSLAVVLLAYTLAFVLLFVLPGDAVLARIGAADAVGTSELSSVDVAPLREELGLEASLLEQYASGLAGLARGDLGDSLVTGEPVTRLIGQALPSTALLAGASLVVSIVLGVLLAVAAVAPRSRVVRGVVGLVPAAWASLPVFWVGILLIYVFAIRLGWFPSSGSDGFVSLVLPATVIGLLGAAQLAQVLISSLRTEVATTYAAVTAPAKGASRWYTVLRHCLRNALLPFLTVLGLRVASLLGGTVVVEQVFSRNGLGRLVVDSVNSVDLTVVLGVVVLLAVVYVVVNALVDAAFPLVDPRLRRRDGAAAGRGAPATSATEEER
ncbi:ABC transporter permease [Georgenia sp. Z1344]|uniref:ABC transporter permease n=1 Tax=Georgenia sp. Z1344 TaxID=3416706 RepID=UPI003CE85DCB